MKNLIIVRHAKSSWLADMENDHDRVLNRRGHCEAALMAKTLLHENVFIDNFVSSTAVRAFTTATYFAIEYHMAVGDIVKQPLLYMAEPPQFLQVIKQFDDLKLGNTVALFSHNDGITHFVNSLTKAHVDVMPTCGVFAIKTDAQQWSQFEQANKTFWFFKQPPQGI